MFGHRYFGARYYGPRYWGDGGQAAAATGLIEQAVYELALAHGGLSALVGTRVYPEAEDREHELPRLVFERVGSLPYQGWSADTDWSDSRFRFTAYGASAYAAKQVIEQVQACFYRLHDTTQAGRFIWDVEATGTRDDGFDEALDQFFESVELEFFHD